MSSKPFTQKTSAADKSIGFEYQYYYFLDRLLNLKTGDTVGLEVLDDVHVSVNAGLQLLFQLKHTTSTAADGSPINLTSLDSDLWKTMSNWSSVISDANDGRAQIAAQILFVRKTEFHLVSNKSESSKNVFLKKIQEFHNGACNLSDAKAVIKDLRNETTNEDIQQYLDNVFALDEKVMEIFFQNLRFHLGVDEITQRIRRSISEKAIEDDDIDNVFERLDSNIREDNFIAIKAGLPICISYDDFMGKYRKIFTSSRKNKLAYVNYTPTMPDDLLKQKFVTQLLHIGDVDVTELEVIADYTLKKMVLARSLFEWNQSGQLITDDITKFHNEVRNKWMNSFRSKFRPARMPSDINGAAIELLDDLRQVNFPIDGEVLNTELSNGELYNLSDLGRIGWHPGWDE